MKQQDLLMLFDPAFRTHNPYPSHAHQYRAYHGRLAWIYNPWTGVHRNPYDIGSDPFGELIEIEGSDRVLCAAQQCQMPDRHA